jgi:hypothetical protein
MRALTDLLTQRGKPASVLRWLQRDTTAELLSAVATHPGPLTHDVLDALSPAPALPHLRRLLIHAGVLEEREEFLEQLTTWIDARLAHAPAEHARLLRPYVTWAILRRARRHAQRRPFTEAAAAWARLRINAALHLLSWLHEHDRTLAETTQADLDQWLAEGSTTRYEARDFLIWARHRHLAGEARIPVRTKRTPPSSIDARQRCASLRHLWHDPGIDIDIRVAGSLVLLFAHPLSRVKLLTTDHIHADGERTRLVLGTAPITVPEPLAALLATLRDQRLSQTAPPTPNQRRTWLFPADPPTRPVHAETLRLQLAAHGINIRTARNAALAEFAADLPATVLADLLGMHVSTATRWVKTLQHDWTAYLAARPTPPNA